VVEKGLQTSCRQIYGDLLIQKRNGYRTLWENEEEELHELMMFGGCANQEWELVQQPEACCYVCDEWTEHLYGMVEGM